MSTQTLRSFSFSLLLHGLCVRLAALVFALYRANPIPPLRQPLTLVPLPGIVSPVDVGSPTPAVAIRIPAPPPRPVPPEPPPSAPEAATAIAPAPAKAVAPLRAKPNSPPSRSMSIDEFWAIHGAQNSARKVPVRAVPRVSESFPIAATLAPVDSSDPIGDPGFTSALLGDLQRAVVAAGISRPGLSVRVEFILGDGGRLRDVRILRASGLPAFDAAVLAAFAKVRARRFSPPEVGRKYEVNFHTAEE